MPRQKPIMIDLVQEYILNKNLKIDMPKEDCFNANTLITIYCSNNISHTYRMSISKIKNGFYTPTECPHCKKDLYYKQKGLSSNYVNTYCECNNLNYTPKKDYYNPWKTGEQIVFTCKTCNNFAYTAKSINYWQESTSKIKYECPYCSNKTERNKCEVGLFETNYSIDELPKKLKEKILSQTKWQMILYNGTKTKATFRCNDCGNIKTILPHNIFSGRNNKCTKCSKSAVFQIEENPEQVIYEY